MEFGNTTATLEMSTDLTTMESGVGDVGIVFQILSGLYNDPQRIIVQEYIANARDAHREVEKFDVPVDVTLPTFLESELKIRDYGPGISPERMSKVFINYGASTKRGSNIQTGGFGIGAKCVFSYTDSCTIETWVEGVYYVYSYMKSEDNKPKCILMNSEPSQDPTGTRISINIRSSDINVVCSNVYYVTQYWNVRPNVINPGAYRGDKYFEYDKTAQGDNWQYLKNRGSKCHVIIDEIPYKFDFEAVFKEYAEKEKYDAIIRSGNFDFMLKTGDVTMSPNREGPVYDLKSVKFLKSVVENAYETIRKNIIDEFDKVDNLFDALDMFERYNHLKKVIGDINWRKMSLGSKNIKFSNKFYKMYRGTRGGRRGNSSNKPSCDYCHEIPVYRGNVYVFNDEKNEQGDYFFSPARMKTILQNVNTFYVIQPNEYDPKYHVEYLTQEDYDKALEEYNDEINIDSFNFKMMTSFEKYKAPKSQRSEKVNIYKFSYCDANRHSNNWDRLNEDFEDLEGYFVEYERGCAVGYTIHEINEMTKKFKINLYGIPARYMKIANKVDTLTPINDFLVDQIASMEQYIIDNNDIIYSKQVLGYTHTQHGIIRRFPEDTKNILINCPEASAYFNASQDILDTATKQYDSDIMSKFDLAKSLLKSSHVVNIKPTHDIETMSKNIFKKYPLLKFFESYSFGSIDADHLNHYLDFMINHKNTYRHSQTSSQMFVEELI